jgi:hypothetical protein
VSETAPIKKRLNNAKRKITATLTLAGFDVYAFEDGPFHLCADSRDGGKRIRICFGSTNADEVRSISRAVMPSNCHREVWQVSDDGKRFVIGRIAEVKKK